MITIHEVIQGSDSLGQLVLQYFRLDYQTGKLYWKRAPHCHADRLGKEAGKIKISRSRGSIPRHHVKIGGKEVRRSKVVFFIANGRWATPFVDHINGDTLDDRPINLREANYSLNNRNRHSRSIRKMPSGKYNPRLSGKSLGTYATLQEAEKIYDEQRQLRWGT
jgi:hypothetical protein